MPRDHLQPYVDALAEHGPGFEATLWRSPAAQRTRFEVATRMLCCANHRVADLGCGTGDFALFLAEGTSPPSAYLGVDAHREMVDAAREAVSGSASFETVFEVLDLVDDLRPVAAWKPDVCVISGTLNTMRQSQALDVVARAFEVSRIGVVFNYLSDRPHDRFVGRDTAPARRFATIEVLDWCMQMTPNVQFRQDYLDGHDATIAITRSQS
ncbi:MAG: class I SAM-dependent methyltransferase [Phycisphaerales bacterium]|jgi:SAM-dependent methyltransferase|nr:class I SAM-dependent methyltransferase [Phycisphaerales bacterium]